MSLLNYFQRENRDASIPSTTRETDEVAKQLKLVQEKKVESEKSTEFGHRKKEPKLRSMFLCMAISRYFSICRGNTQN